MGRVLYAEIRDQVTGKLIGTAQPRRFEDFTDSELSLLIDALENRQYYNLAGEVNREIKRRNYEPV